jgi:hypothetical protein
MAGKKKLTDKQWHEIERRYNLGEGARALSREFDVPESTIRAKFHAQSKRVKEVAHQVFEAEQAFKSLPLSAQISAQTLIDDLRSISTHLAGAAKYGAMTAHRLNGIANRKLEYMDEAALNDPDDDAMNTIRLVAGLTEVANKSSQIGINLLAANKEYIAQHNKPNGNNLEHLDDEDLLRELQDTHKRVSFLLEH